MMAAPNLRTLLDFETNVETAAKTFLENATGLTASSIFASLDQDDLVLPRLAVMFELSEAIDPVDPKKTGSSDLEYRKYNGTLNIIITSDGSTDGSQADHRNHRADVRAAMLLNADNWSTPTGNIVVKGAGSTDVNGVYEQDGDENGKPFYSLGQSATIRWDGSRWLIRSVDNQVDRYENNTSSQTPDLATGDWDVAESASEPLPTVTAENILPYYDINYMRPSANNFEIDGDLAVSTLSYQINLAIRNDAFPD
jgi:hypothetical protein